MDIDALSNQLNLLAGHTRTLATMVDSGAPDAALKPYREWIAKEYEKIAQTVRDTRGD